MDVDQARRHNESFSVDLASALGRIDPFGDLGQDSIHHQDVPDGIDRLTGVDDPSAPDQQRSIQTSTPCLAASAVSGAPPASR